MTRDEALELIDRIAFLPTIKGPDRKSLAEIYRACAESDDPLEWVKVVKSCYTRTHYGGPALNEAESRYGEMAQQRLEAELASALGLRSDEVEAYIKKYIDENI